MIGHLTKRIFTMSPRIVLLFLGLVVALCQAAVQAPTIAYTSGELICTATTGTNNCHAGAFTAGCVFKWRIGTKVVHTGKDHNEKAYTPTRNADYNCLANDGQDDSTPSADEPVTTLAYTPSIVTWVAPVCGKKNMVLTCNVGSGSGGAATNYMRVVKKDDPAQVDFVAQTSAITKTFSPFANADKGDYFCEAAEDEHGTNMARSDAETLGCNACDASGQDCTGADDSRTTCDTHTKDCINPAASTAAGTTSANSVASGSTGGGSGSNTGSTGSGGGGGNSGSTGSGGSGTTSGASDLGRPASVLAIVCSLLTLTLNLRG